MTEDRAGWLRRIRRENAQQEDALSEVYDHRWGDIEDTHRAFVERFLASLTIGGRVLDAACGTGKHFGMVINSGCSLVGVDHSAGHLARAREKFPQVPTELREIQDLSYRAEFDGVMCVDALEMIPPEDWPVVLAAFRRALRPRGRLYVTIERVPEDQVRRGTERGLAEAGFEGIEDLQGPMEPRRGLRLPPRHRSNQGPAGPERVTKGTVDKASLPPLTPLRVRYTLIVRPWPGTRAAQFTLRPGEPRGVAACRPRTQAKG